MFYNIKNAYKSKMELSYMLITATISNLQLWIFSYVFVIYLRNEFFQRDEKHVTYRQW